MSDLQASTRLDPLRDLLSSTGQLWRGRELAHVAAQSTGFVELDAKLPGGGWPLGALIEIVCACEGLGEVRVTVPALKAWCDEGRTVAFVKPPHTPYAPALARSGVNLESVLWIAPEQDEDARWAAEQLLREGAAAVLLWSGVRDNRALRRLQLAAEAGKACAFLYRPTSVLGNSSPAALRLALSAVPLGTRLQIVKVRGGQPGAVTLPLPSPAT